MFWRHGGESGTKRGQEGKKRGDVPLKERSGEVRGIHKRSEYASVQKMDKRGPETEKQIEREKEWGEKSGSQVGFPDIMRKYGLKETVVDGVAMNRPTQEVR